MATAVSFTDRYGPGLDLNLSTGFQLVEEGFWLEDQQVDREWLSQAPYPGAVSTGDHEAIRIAHATERMTQQASATAMRTLYQSLIAELRRPVNEIRWNPHGGTNPFFLDTFRTGFASLTRGGPPPNPFYLLQDPRGMDIPIPISPVIRGPGANLLTKTQSDLQAGTTGWQVNGVGTIAHSVGADNSLHFTHTSAGSGNGPRTLGGTSGIRVTPGVAYTASVLSLFMSNARSVILYTFWFNSAGTFLSLDGTTTAVPATTPTAIQHTSTAPASARFAAMKIDPQSAGIGETFYVDDAQFEIGSSRTAWKVGGEGAAI